MTVTEAYKYIEGIASRGSVPGLESIENMLSKIENPEKSFDVVHVTGTNGKGSFCAMLSSVLIENGYKVGVFSSPHLIDIRECITVDRQMIPEEDLARLTSRLSPISESLSHPLTQFEFITALCFEYFKEQKVDIAVIEVGMGGRLDATNVFRCPLLSVITGISADHTSWLGSSLEDIAREKSGIIKKGCPVYFGGADEGGCSLIIESTAKEMGCQYYKKSEEPTKIINIRPGTMEFEYNGDNFTIMISGEYQADNAVKVIDCCNILNNHGFNISKNHINKAFKTIKRPARFEVLSDNPFVVYDGGHNPECATALVKSVKTYFGGNVDVIMGVLADKDYKKMAAIISEIAATVYTITPNNPRALDGSVLANVFNETGTVAYSCQNYKNAIEEWQKNGKNTLIVTGSLYSYGDFIQEFNSINKV